MKKLIFGGLFLLVVSSGIIGCKKDELSLPNQMQDEVTELSTREPSRGKKACSVRDSNGNEIAAGTRCGTPTGDCGKTTNCKAVTPKSMGTLPDGMTFEQFAEIWNDDTRRQYLIDLGYYEEDER